MLEIVIQYVNFKDLPDIVIQNHRNSSTSKCSLNNIGYKNEVTADSVQEASSHNNSSLVENVQHHLLKEVKVCFKQMVQNGQRVRVDWNDNSIVKYLTELYLIYKLQFK